MFNYLRQAGRDHPMAVIFAAMACGISLFQDLHAAIFCLMLLVLLFSLHRLPHIVIGLILGMVSVSAVAQPVAATGEHELRARIVSSGYWQGVYRIEAGNVILDGRKVRGRALLNVYRDISGLLREKGRAGFKADQDPISAAPDVNLAGCTLHARVHLRAHRALGNEGEFNRERYLSAQGITMQGTIKDTSGMRISGKPRRDYPARRVLADMDRQEAQIILAGILGDRSDLTPAMRDAFAALGLSHLLAISGLHVAVVIFFGYSIAFSIIRIIPPLAGRIDTPLVSKIIGLLCAVGYALVVEPSYPTMRAVIMAVILIGALFFSRRTHLVDSLALAGTIIILIWPMSIFTVSFLLSFAAVFGLAVVLERLCGPKRLLQYIAVPVAASAFTLPIAGYVFGFISPVGVLANLILVPVYSFSVIPLGLMGFGAGFIHAPLAQWCFSQAMEVIGFIIWCAERFGSLKPVARPPLIWVYLCYLGLILAFLGNRVAANGQMTKSLKLFVLPCICLAIAVLPIIHQYRNLNQGLRFHFINVGQGDSVLITKEDRAVLIDAGGTTTGFDTGRFIVAPYLLNQGITKLDLIIATHSHPDHAGGLPFILQRFFVRELWVNILHDPDFAEVLKSARNRSIPVNTVCYGDSRLFKGMDIDVLHPQVRHAGVSGLDRNLQSIAVRIGDKDMRGVFMADAGMFAELSLAHLGRDICADVLKVAHHGSAKTCQKVFLETVKPRYAVITCGYQNRYDLPVPEVLERLAAHAVQVFRTDEDGGVVILSKKIQHYR